MWKDTGVKDVVVALVPESVMVEVVTGKYLQIFNRLTQVSTVAAVVVVAVAVVNVSVVVCDLP